MKLPIQILASWRLLGLAWHIARGFFTLVWHFPRWSERQKNQSIQALDLNLHGLLAIKFDIVNEPPRTAPVLLAANHVSWLDVYVILATFPCRFVAKSEVRHWPLVGTLAAAIGTLFIARQSPRDALRVVHQMATHLRQGDTVAIFPEGTTSNGLQVCRCTPTCLKPPSVPTRQCKPLRCNTSTTLRSAPALPRQSVQPDLRGANSLAQCVKASSIFSKLTT